MSAGLEGLVTAKHRLIVTVSLKEGLGFLLVCLKPGVVGVFSQFLF